MSSERNFDSHLGGDLLAMGFDVVLALDTHSSRKPTEEHPSLEIPSNNSTENNLGYGDMLLHRFDEDLNEGDIAQLTDLTYSLPKGDSESAQSFLAKIACQDLARELGSTQISPQKGIEATLFSSVNDNVDSHNNDNINATTLKTSLQPVDVYGRVSLYEGKLILQLKHFNASTSYPLSVGECWLCREKMSNGSQIHSHKHALQGLFQINDEFVQMDIDHYIIPDQALDPDPPPDVNKNLIANSLIDNVNHAALGHISDCRQLPLTEDINKCSESLEVNLDTIGETLHNSENNLINSNDELGNSKPHDELQYSEAEFHNVLNSAQQSLNSTVPISSNSFLNTFANTDLRMEPVVSTNIVETPNESIIINHVADNSFATSALTLPTCNNSNNTITNTDAIISKSCITQTHSTQTDMTNIPEICTSNTDTRGEDNFIQHTTYEPNIGNKDQLETYQNFFGHPYSYSYESHEINTNLPKITSNSEPAMGSVNLCDDAPLHQNCSPSKSPSEGIKKTEVGAKKRKSKAQRKLSQIRMKGDDELPLHNLYINKNTTEIFGQNEIEEDINAVKIQKNKNNENISGESSKIVVINRDDNLKMTPPTHSLLKKEFNVNCPFCSETFSNGKISNFKDHLKGHKFDETYLFTCPVCSEKFPGSVKYTKHVRIHCAKRHFCTKCDANYSRSDKLKNHITNVHGNKKKLACEFCPKSFSRLEYLKKHKNIHLGNKFECDICHKFYSTLFNLQYHKKSHANEKMPYPCQHCEKAYLRKDLLHHHTVKEHKNKRYKCDICSKMYSRKDVLRRHKETHDDKRISFNCDICDKKFYRKDSLKAHSYKHQEKKNLGNIKDDKPKTKKPKSKDLVFRVEKQQKEQCNICLKYLPSSLRLEKHLQWHQSQLKLKAYFERECMKNFKCDTCSKTFRTKEFLKRHILRSHNTSTNSALSLTILKETKLQSEKSKNNKKFVCEICSKGFTRSSNLKVHLETHLKKDADDDHLLAEIPDVLKAYKSQSLKGLITSTDDCSNAVLGQITKESSSNVSGLHLLLDGNLVTPNSSFSSNFSADLPATFCSSPSSPVNLSTEAMGAASYLLTNAFYEGTYQ